MACTRHLYPKMDFVLTECTGTIFTKSTLFGNVAEVYSLLVNTMQLKVKVFSKEIDEPHTL